MEKIDFSQLVTPQEAADILKISTETLAKWRCRGINLPFVRVSRKVIRYRLFDIHSYIKKNIKNNTIISGEK
ncbi:helix-turn-helix domain-containing protein [Yunchengibacter salinarum]|uniref:helix-turn-helix domain-containing protein n=1 Tax=Yunchengibacter salinarum TaxID=3133399 RepID=UPI0035B663C1